MTERTIYDDQVIVLHRADNVAVARERVEEGAIVRGPSGPVACATSIPRGHKMAVRDIAEGEQIVKYDQIIGFASVDIRAGTHVHTHNVLLRDFKRDNSDKGSTRAVGSEIFCKVSTFYGYHRADGRVGTRNYIAILSTVNCSATVCRGIADAFRGPALEKYPNVDGVVAFTHDYGCMSTPRLEKVIAGYTRHPNVAGFLMVGLGCESNSVAAVAGNYDLPENDLARYLVIQEEGGTRGTIDKGIAAVREMLPLANRCQREPAPISALVLGLECGGSDAYSGITANPALGRAADMLVGLGGTAVLSETPEIFGAEHLLTRRAASPEIAQQLLDLMDWWKDYAAYNGAELNNNPSEGNKRGGLTTIIEKSLGAIAKGGTTPLNGVFGYGDPITVKGLAFMDSPGYDPVSVTGMIAGGANIVCFTTGRGSAFGGKPVPTLKLATTSRLFEAMSDDMDINAGLILDGKKSLDSMGEAILEAIIEAASGQPTKSELNGYGSEEFAPWHVGAVL